MVAELRAFQAGQLIAARNYTRWELFKRWLGKHRVVVGIATAAVVVLGVVGAVSIQRILHEKHKEELALAVSDARRKSLLEERGKTVSPITLFFLWRGRGQNDLEGAFASESKGGL